MLVVLNSNGPFLILNPIAPLGAVNSKCVCWRLPENVRLLVNARGRKVRCFPTILKMLHLLPTAIKLTNNTESMYSHLNRRHKQVDPLQPTTKINQYTCSEAHKHSSYTYNLVHQEASEIWGRWQVPGFTLEFTLDSILWVCGKDIENIRNVAYYPWVGWNSGWDPWLCKGQNSLFLRERCEEEQFSFHLPKGCRTFPASNKLRVYNTFLHMLIWSPFMPVMRLFIISSSSNKADQM